MSVIGKIPFVHQILSSLSNANLIRLETLLNHDLPEPIELSLFDKHYAITDAHKGVNYVKLHLNRLNNSVAIGFLCYSDADNCGLFAFYQNRNEKMATIKINLAKGNCEYLDEGLDIDELRSELRDLINEKTGGDFNAHVLEDYIKGSDTVVVDWDESGEYLSVKLDETYKTRVEDGMAHEVEITNVPEIAEQGVLEEEDYIILNTFPRSTIFFNNERYYPMDIGHEEGYLGYSHVGFENGVFMLKNITITKSTRAWQLNVKEVA